MFLFVDLTVADYLTLLNSVSFLITIVCAIHTYKLCSNFTQGSKRPWYSYWWGIIGVYLIIILPIFLFRSFLYEPFHIPANSMAPTYNQGDYIVISKLGYGNYGSYGINLIHTKPTNKIKRGDVIVFSFPPNPKVDYIKRVIALPGDTVSYKSKRLFINNEAVPTKKIGNYTQRNKNTSEYNFDEFEESLNGNAWHVINFSGFPKADFDTVVPPNNYFVLGDNRDNSSDSRIWGTVPEENIKGKVIYSTNPKLK